MSDNLKKWSKRLSIFFLLSLTFFLALGARNQVSRYMEWNRLPAELVYLPDKKIIKTFSLGFQENIADYYWLKSIQYFGDKKTFHKGATSEELTTYLVKSLYPLLDLVTDLAPNFGYAYHFGQISLTIMDTNSDLAIKLLKKGFQEHPDDWKIPYYLGFDYYYYQHDYKKAASYYQDAARLAPPNMKWLNSLSARLYAESKNTELAVSIITDMLKNVSTDTPEEREHLEKLYKLAVMENDMHNLEDAVKKYQEMFSRKPGSLQELIDKKIIEHIPIEPHGGEYTIDDLGNVNSTGSDERFHGNF